VPGLGALEQPGGTTLAQSSATTRRERETDIEDAPGREVGLHDGAQRGPVQVPVAASHVSPAAQQWPQPQSVCVAEQSGMQAPPEHVWPHPHPGLQVCGVHVPLEQNSPPGHAPVVQ
jgi:hypothetical protein